MEVILNQEIDMYPKSNWVTGAFYNRKNYYGFSAKIFSEPSDYGINNGNISKLYVENIKTEKTVISYDRGHVEGNRSSYTRGMIKDLIDWLTDYAVKMVG